MKAHYVMFIFIALLCLPAACSAVTIIEPDCGHEYCGFSGYSWDKSSRAMELTITSSGEYAFASANFPRFRVKVESSGVTLDGKGVTIHQIDGRNDLNLKNIHIDYNGSGSGISECNDIVHSFIFVASTSNTHNSISGIGKLHGTIDGTTTITVTSPGTAYGIGTVSGTIAGGTFTVTSHQRDAYGVQTIGSLSGTISGGTFTITAQEDAYGVRTTYSLLDKSAAISGGTFAVTGQRFAYGVYELSGEVSGGEFIVTSQQGSASGVGELSGEVSGGTFTVTGQANAYGIWVMDGVNAEVSDGTFIVTSQQDSVSGVGRVTGKVSGGAFIITSQQGSASGVGEVTVDYQRRGGEVTGGEFIVTSNQNLAYGVLVLAGGEVSGGRFTAAGQLGAYKVGEISENGQVTGGTFTIEEVKENLVPLSPTLNPTNMQGTTIGEADFTLTEPRGAAPTRDATQASVVDVKEDSPPEPTHDSPGFGAFFTLLAVSCAAVCMFLGRRI